LVEKLKMSEGEDDRCRQTEEGGSSPEKIDGSGLKKEEQTDDIADQLAGLSVSGEVRPSASGDTSATSATSAAGKSKKTAAEPKALTLEDIAAKIKSGKIKRIITMAGAGISTSAGIPDFRSEGTGLYATIAEKYPDLESPEDIFCIEYFRENPKPFYEFAKELLPPSEDGGYQPTPCHRFIKKLADKKLLVRHYTQNIDGLERKAGVSAKMLVEAHGTFSSAHCIDTRCRKAHSEEFVRDHVFKDELPMCSRCQTSLVKPDIVFFGESLPERFVNLTSKDFKKCDLLIVMGTSLMVHPFASLIDFVSRSCPRLLINMDNRSGSFSVRPPHNLRNVFWQGKCDDGCRKLEELLGWNDNDDDDAASAAADAEVTATSSDTKKCQT